MNYPIIALKVSARDYSKLVALASTVTAALTGNLSFPSPSVSLATLATATTAVVEGIAAWGTKGNRGSHADLSNLRNAALTLHQMLKAEAEYVQSTAAVLAGNDYSEMSTLIMTSGFQLANTKNPQGVLQAVRNLHSFQSRKLLRNQVKLRWLKPLGLTSSNNVKLYKVMRGTTAVFADAVEIATTTKTTFLDTNTTNASVNWFYWVLPFNTDGQGVASDVVAVTVLAV